MGLFKKLTEHLAGLTSVGSFYTPTDKNKPYFNWNPVLSFQSHADFKLLRLRAIGAGIKRYI